MLVPTQVLTLPKGYGSVMCGCKKKLLYANPPESILEHLSQGGKHRLSKATDWNPPKGYMKCSKGNCYFPIPGKEIPKDNEKINLEVIVKHLKKDPNHRDNTVRYLVPSLITAITVLFVGLIVVYIVSIENLPNIRPKMVVVNITVASFVLVSAGLSLLSLRLVSRLVSGYIRPTFWNSIKNKSRTIWESIMEKEPDYFTKEMRENQRKIDNGIFVTLIIGTIVYAVITIAFPLDDRLNIMISATMLASAGYLLAWYRYHRGGRSANEEVRRALSGQLELMDKVWNYGFNVFPLTTSGSGSHTTTSTNGTPPEKIQVFGIIYGILAGLAISVGLQTYLEQFINPYFSHMLNPSIQNLQPFLQLLPSIRLIDFFLIAVPISHSGYIFLSGLTIKSTAFQEYSKNAPALTAIFCICIVQVAFLFFLGNSIASNCSLDSNSTQGICKEPAVKIVWRQTSWLVIWLVLTSFFAGVGALFIKRLIKNNRIPTEWTLLHLITIGFIISAYLPILSLPHLSDLESQNEKGLIVQFNFLLLGVLTGRTALDYIIGLKIYFPDIPTTPDTGQEKKGEATATRR